MMALNHGNDIAITPVSPWPSTPQHRTGPGHSPTRRPSSTKSKPLAERGDLKGSHPKLKEARERGASLCSYVRSTIVSVSSSIACSMDSRAISQHRSGRKWRRARQTLLCDILDLVQRGVLVRNPGSGRSTSYSLAEIR